MLNNSSYNYTFPAIRGIQAGREYYVVMCPLKLIPKLFTFDGQEIPPSLRAQRILNKARIPEMAKYILKNDEDYIFSSLTASIDGAVKFSSLGKKDGDYKVGQLVVSIDSNFLINDGQHRVAAISEALKQQPSIGSETISIVLFIDAGLKHAQQMFADLNKHAIRPTRSIGILYDSRDEFSRFMLDLIEETPIFKNLVELEKTTISNRSPTMFTLSSLYQANLALLGKSKKNYDLTVEEKNFAKAFWKEVTNYIPEWQQVIQRKINSAELRKDFVHSHGLALHSLGIIGYSLKEKYTDNWKDVIKKIDGVDWARSNTNLWEGRAMIAGRISKAQTNLRLTVNVLKKSIGLDLTEEEEKIEQKFYAGHGGNY